MDLVKQSGQKLWFQPVTLVLLWQQALRLGRLRGIDRPAIGAVFPTLVASKPVLILMSARC